MIHPATAIVMGLVILSIGLSLACAGSPTRHAQDSELWESQLPLALTSPGAAPCSSPPVPPKPRDLKLNCLFPPDTDNRVHSADVDVQLCVDTLGEPKSVAVLREPGHGFALAVRKCLADLRFFPALDSLSKPTVGLSPVIHVKFRR